MLELQQLMKRGIIMYENLAKEIIKGVGGQENIDSLTHCVTRLRFVLKDVSKVNEEALKATEGVVGVAKSIGQFQVIIGTHVGDVYKAVQQVLHGQEGPKEEKKEKFHRTPLQHFISIMTDVFAPFFSVIAACGILKGFLPLLAAAGVLSNTSGTYTILYSLADGFFYYLPIMLAYTSSKKFGLPVIEGLAIGAGLLYPNLLSTSTAAHDSLFGIPVTMPPGGDYTTTAVPIIVAIAFAAWFEKLYAKHIPAMIKSYVVPLITCFVTFVLTLFVIGPAATGVTHFLSFVLNHLEAWNNLIYSGVLGVIWQLILMMGLHYAVLPIVMNNFSTLGYDTTLSSTFGCNFAQMGAILAIRLKTKDNEMKKRCFPSLFSVSVGIIEPALYGVTLQKRSVFIITCIVSGITGLGMTLFGARAYRLAGFGVFGYAAYADPSKGGNAGILSAVIWSLFALVLSFVLTFLTYKDDVKKA